MATFLRVDPRRRQAEHVEHARILERICRETGGNVAEERARLQMQHSAADTRSLRGIPAIGRGVQGVIYDNQPEGALLAKEERRGRVPW